MKKLFTLVLATAIFAAQQTFAAQTASEQTFVVAEVFTSTACGLCPRARAALADMGENQEEFPYLIPLLWQIDPRGTGNQSPNIAERWNFYSATGTPHTRFSGDIEMRGASPTVPQMVTAYTEHYNTVAQRPAPMRITVDYEIIEHRLLGSQIRIISDVELISDITTTNNRIFFVLTYDWGAKQPGNYDASVVAFNSQAFELTASGQSDTFNQTFTLNSAWDLGGIRVVSFVQTTTDNLIIHQAGTKRVANATNISVVEQDDALNVFPNPVLDGRLAVEIPENAENAMIRIYDFSGRLMLTHTANRSKTEIDISHLPNGLYVVRVGQNTARIIKQ